MKISTQDREVSDMEIEIVVFVVKGSAKLTSLPMHWQEQIKVWSISVVLLHVFDLKLSVMHLTQIIRESVYFMSSMYPYVKVNWDANYFFPVDSKDYGSLFVPHKRKILCRYNDIYVVITTSDVCRYNEISSRYNDFLSRYNNILSRYNDLQWMSL